MYIFLVSTIVLLASLCAFLFCRCYIQCHRIEENERIGGEILRNIAAYILLVDPEFNVLRTNYFALTETPADKKLLKVGNLLHCKNGEDAGECGTHTLCADCPVRKAITAAFAARQNFTGLETPMTLYTSADKTESVDCVVTVSGNYLETAGGGRFAHRTDRKRYHRAKTHPQRIGTSAPASRRIRPHEIGLPG